MRGRRQPMLANERDELVCRDQECDCVNEPEQPQDYKTGQPVRISECKKSLKNGFAVSHFENSAYQQADRASTLNGVIIKPPAWSRALTPKGMSFSFPAFRPG